MSATLRAMHFTLPLSLALGLCDKPLPPDPPLERNPTSITLSATTFGVDDGGTQQLHATLKDQQGRGFDTPPNGWAIAWSTSDNAVASVNSSGLVQGNRPGEVMVTATAGDLSASATGTVRAVPIAVIMVSGNNQEGPPGRPLQDSLRVRVLDRHGSAIAGASVSFRVASGGGSLSPSTAISNAEGYASATWILGPEEVNSATVSVGTIQPITFMARTFSPHAEEIRVLITSIPDVFERPNPGVRPTGPEIQSDTIISDSVFNCTSRSYTMDSNFEEVTAFRPNTEVIWPGALVQGNTVLDGAPALIPVRRTPATISIQPGGPQSSITVEDPTNATVESAVQQLARTNQPPATGASLSFQYNEAYSLDQGMMSLGVSARWLTGNARAGLQIDRASRKRHVYVKFVQTYFTVAFTPPGSPEQVFDRSVTAAELSRWIGAGNPAAYISSVTYGRILIFQMSSEASHDKMKAALDLSYKGAGWSGSASLRAELEQVLQRSEFRVFALGGGAEDAVRVITTGEFKGYLEAGANFSPNSPGLPISYTVKFLRNNHLAKLGYTTDYTERHCLLKTAVVSVRYTAFTPGGTCDGPFDSKGEFYWEFSANGRKVSERPWDNYVSLSKNQRFAISDPAVEFLVEFRPGSNIELSGWAKDKDGSDSDRNAWEWVGEFRKLHTFERNNPWQTGTHSAHMYSNPNCQGWAEYTINRVR